MSHSHRNPLHFHWHSRTQSRGQRNNQAIISGAPVPTVLSFAFPIVMGNIFQQLYNIVDAMVVGKFLGDIPLGGISVAGPMMDIATSLIIGATIGVGVLAAQLYGGQEWDQLKKVHSTVLTGGAVLVVLLSAVCMLFGGTILRMQGTEEVVCQEAMKYLRIIFLGMIFCFLYNYYASMLRSFGNSRTPFVILLVSSTLHALLDVLFVGVWNMGIQGVAISTVLCQMFSAGWCILYANRYCIPLRLGREELAFHPGVAGRVVSFAWAAALQQAVVCIGRFLVQGMLTSLSTNTVTGYNMGMRTEAFLLCFTQGLSAAVVVCLSQNLGRGDYKRFLRFLKVGVVGEVIVAVCSGLVCLFFGEQLIALFSDNPEVIAAGALYSGTMAFCYMFGFVGEMIQCFFRSMGRLRLTMIASLSQVALRVVMSWFLIPIMGIPGICLSVATGWFLLVIIEGGYALYVGKEIRAKAETQTI